jgi:hypothetical protein
VRDVTHDFRMLKKREDFCFAGKTFAVVFFVEEDFDRDDVARSQIVGAENSRHSALSNEGFEAKTSAHDLPDLHVRSSIDVKRAKV